MATFTIISEADAPAMPKAEAKANENQLFAASILGQLTDGQVATLELEENDSVRTIKRAFTTVANRQGKAVHMYLAANNSNLLCVGWKKADENGEIKTRKPRAKKAA